nr:BRCT and DNA-repair protein domain containing protein [Haemonchus contortus]
MVSEALREENFAFWNGETIVDEMLDSQKGVSSPENRAEVSKPSCSKESSKPEVHKYPKTNESKSAEGKTNDNVRARLDDSLSRMQNDNMEGKSSFGRYMRLKKDKLRYQVNVSGRPANAASNIFEGISIFVNGYTDPSALELRNLIQLHGGEYHCYYEYGVTTYIIATSLANVKVQKTRQNETFLKPDWVVDCIAAGRLLEVDKYILLPSSKERSIAEVFSRNNEAKESSIGGSILDARDPKFLEEYYARSRLHLISTLAQEMKDWVKTMRETDTPNFSGRASLKYLSSPDFVRLASKIIFHIDLDCFFVSVALRDRPDLIGKPVAITHSKGVSAGFSELASVSYAAREYGLRNGMIVRNAIKLCPNLVCLPYLFDEYRAVSKTIYTIVARYTLEIRAVSCDEMYVDCTKFFDELQIADPVAFAEHLRAEVRRETGCPASIGIGRSILISRLATRYAKPDGVRYIPDSESYTFIANEKIQNLPGLGYHTHEKLVKEFGLMERCSDLQAIPQSDLERVLGKKVGDQLYKMCRGLDDGKNFVAASTRKSVSCDINYGIRFTKKSEVAHFLHVIGQELERKLKQAGMVTSSVTLKLMIRSFDAPFETEKYLGHGKCDTQNKTVALDHPTGCAQVITMVVLKLFTKLSPVIEDIRGIGVQCGRLALVTDVGYSATSEAITRMFRTKAKKKGFFYVLEKGIVIGS